MKSVSRWICAWKRGLYGEKSDYKDALLNLGAKYSVLQGLVEPLQDEDGDGVLDDQDRCPGTPAGAQVDTDGCSGLWTRTRMA